MERLSDRNKGIVTVPPTARSILDIKNQFLAGNVRFAQRTVKDQMIVHQREEKILEIRVLNALTAALRRKI